MVCSTVRLCVMQRHGAVGIQLHYGVVGTAATAISACSTRSNKAALVTTGSRQYFFEAGLSFVVSHTSGMMVRHGDADSFFESSRVASRDRIPLIPFDDFPSFVEDFHGS